ncbi:superoxide dismutase family protein [Lentzea sp. NBC_00516]|uniref:superoxide dismutase family protein n=1 Tax=Lentzea sp. NBC_00516 TaxID=2903582 RepID=UPI002E81A763|nr:superoxide dismutase family protein [Lentzea sp. NBC_00516]WUD28544.1 superoxide dismutase family protein [Lentzea sp. NBC_00516]
MRTTASAVIGAALFAGGLAACSPDAPEASSPTSAAVAPVAGTSVAEPAAAGDQPKAITYDAKRAPVGARLATSAKVENGRTTVTLTVTGLLPGTKYGSHVHTKACGAKPADSGPHYQHEKDPVSPSVDPKFANAANEIWLDFTTDDKGAATAEATVGWEFRKGEANAVVVHASHTHTEAGKAGTAGDRLACLTNAF